eukprot:c13183_g1_i2.p1 GENE.c13183_g1_i2~~c13183_g1_i2.p1  ORF type:complete len:273 (-),score=47.91 c13183_g1_i2:27-845(-)
MTHYRLLELINMAHNICHRAAQRHANFNSNSSLGQQPTPPLRSSELMHPLQQLVAVTERELVVLQRSSTTPSSLPSQSPMTQSSEPQTKRQRTNETLPETMDRVETTPRSKPVIANMCLVHGDKQLLYKCFLCDENVCSDCVLRLQKHYTCKMPDSNEVAVGRIDRAERLAEERRRKLSLILAQPPQPRRDSQAQEHSHDRMEDLNRKSRAQNLLLAANYKQAIECEGRLLSSVEIDEKVKEEYHTLVQELTRTKQRSHELSNEMVRVVSGM